ncbi:MAG: mismatch-specific DNA-glycosylase [Rhodospirillales bacterium]|nr:mismatch-specific DNA-glycosylase [Rhodospirillales bacterium]
MISTSKHILPDVLAPNLKIVFCGSAAGTKSAQLGMPYAGPGNKFWPTLHAAGFTPTLWHPSDFKKLPTLGYGLTDINKTEFGMDVDLTDGDDPDALRRKIMKYQPRILAFTAKRPAMVFLARKKLAYGFQDDTIGATRLYVLPSPSGRAGSFWDIETWRTLADAVK